MLLLQRAQTLGAHPGPVAFQAAASTGGNGRSPRHFGRPKRRPGWTLQAWRSSGSLPELGLARSNFLVTPVLGWWASPSPVHVVDYGESAQVFRVAVRDLLDPDNRVMATVGRAGKTFQNHAFTVYGVVVWGFTGIIFDRLFEQLGWAGAWDRGRLYGIDV